LVKKYFLQQTNENMYLLTTNFGQLVGDSVLPFVVEEINQGVYYFDFSGKVMLDVGGFMGETAVYFFKTCRVKKVVVYEPVVAHSEFIEENLRLNGVVAEVHYEGIGDSDGFANICYDKTDTTFGFENVCGKNELTIKVKNISNVIVESGADVAKFDCEGAEKHLVNVSIDVLRRLEYVIIEAHSVVIKELIEKKFAASGFVLDKPQITSGGVFLLYFKRAD